MKLIADILIELEAHPGKLDKMRILKENDSELFRKVLNYALDPYKMFYIKKIPDLDHKYEVGDWEGAFATLDKLRSREVTGHAGIALLKETFENLGTLNEIVLRRIVLKDLRCGVAVGLVNKVFPGLIPEFNVSLANQFNEKGLSFPCCQEPKYDGWRCLAFIEGTTPDSVTFMSRGGKPFETLDDIAESIVKIFDPGTVLDGEIMSGSFQNTASVVSRKKGNAKDDKKVYVVFDVLTAEEFKNHKCDVPYWLRISDRLVPASFELEGITNIQIPNTVTVNNLEEARENFARYLKEGFEGSILKKIEGKYDFKRSDNWMKMKPFETIDVEITGFQEGTGKHIGRLGALHYKHNGEDCRVGTGFSDKEREYFWQNQKELSGAIVEVEYMQNTDDGKTRHARFLRLRSYKGEKA